MITVAPELTGGLASIEAAGGGRGRRRRRPHRRRRRDGGRGVWTPGATVVTHLFNAMPPIHHREPGPIPRLLSDDGCMVELIADGFHLHPRSDRDGRRGRRSRSGRPW